MGKNNLHAHANDSILMPDLTVDRCPATCNQDCERVWINDVIGHRIICACYCHQKKFDVADGFREPDSAASSQFSLEETKTS